MPHLLFFPNQTMPRERVTICRICQGTGHELEMGEETCPKCAGTGRDNFSDCWAEPCIKCNGSRKVPYCRRSFRPCYNCKGSGTVKY